MNNTIKLIATGALCTVLITCNGPATSADPGVASPPATDRVGFPTNYQSTLTLLSRTVREEQPAILTVYGNHLTTSVTRADQLPYPNGSILVMEFANSVKDSEGQPLRDASGELLRQVVHVDVMRRGKGFGKAYGNERAGEWEFMSYRPDGSYNVPPEKSVECAACHAKAGRAKDYVFRLRSH